MVIRHLVRPSEYHDSVTLMETAHELTRLPGVADSAVVMATAANKAILREAGLLLPAIEVAAANDLPEFRRTFGRKLAYRGGIDKRAIAKGGEAIEREIERVSPIIRDGGYIPGCDHGVPADVAWPDYVRYVKLLAEETGWL